jgi:hypothetical protein
MNFGFSGQAGVILEGGITPVEFEIVYNFYLGDLDILYSPGAHYYLGTPTGLSGEFHSGYELIYGVSKNARLLGWDIVGGGSLEADSFFKLGLSTLGSRSVSCSPFDYLEEGYFYVDPIRKRTIDKQQLNTVAAANVGGTGTDIGVFADVSYTSKRWTLFDINLPWERSDWS